LIDSDNCAPHNGCNDEAPSHGPPPRPQRFSTCSSIAVEESAQQRDTKGNERGQQRFEDDSTRYLPSKDSVAMMHKDQQAAHKSCRQEGSAKAPGACRGGPDADARSFASRVALEVSCNA
jgi:hypothetical protein